MKTKLLRSLYYVAALYLSVLGGVNESVCTAQSISANKAPSGLSLEVNVDNTPANVNAPTVLIIKLVNSSAAPVYLMFENIESYLTFETLTAKGEPIPLTRYGKYIASLRKASHTGSHSYRVQSIPAGKSATFRICLNRISDITLTGVYTVRVAGYFMLDPTDGYFELVSNTARVEVKGDAWVY